MELEKEILERLQELWPDTWQKVIDFHERLENKMPAKWVENRDIKQMLIEKIEARERVIQFEKETLEKIIPKDELEEGVTYVALEGTEHLTRHVTEARWEDGWFYYKRNKFGYEFEDTMHHFTDAFNIGLAGFTPIRKK